MEVDRERFDTRFWVEYSSGELSTFQGIEDSLKGPKSVLESSYGLVVEGRVFRFLFRSHSLWEESYRWSYECQSNYPIDGRVDGRHIGWGAVVFFEESSEALLDQRHKMLQKTWDCVLLFESPLHVSCLLIIEWVGNDARRVGNFQFGLYDQDNGDLRNLPSVRRKFRLI